MRDFRPELQQRRTRLHRVWRGAALVTGAVAVVLAWDDSGDARKKRLPPCPAARYVLGQPLVVGNAATMVGGISVGGDGFAIDGICDPVDPTLYRATRKKGTRVRAKWPSCAGLRGKVRFDGRIVGDCRRLRGRLRAKGFRRPIAGVMSSCGDGVIDAGGGEECDPPVPGLCSGQCRLGASATIGAAGGRLTSADGLLTLDVPPGALAGDTVIAIRRLAADELSQDARDLGATVGWVLGPDGLQFAVPVTLTVQVGAPLGGSDGVGLPLALLFTESGAGPAEPLPEQQFTVDDVNGAVAASGTLTHFSAVFFNNDQRFGRVVGVIPEGTPTGPALSPVFEVPVGTSFSVDLTVELNHSDGSQVDASHDDMSGGTVTYAGQDPLLIPDVRSGTPKKQNIPGYRCATPGDGFYESTIGTATFFPFVRVGNRRVSAIARPRILVRCVGAALPTSTTTTTTPGATTTSSTTSSSTTTTVTTTTLPTTTTTQATTTTTTSTTTTTTIPCALDSQSPPVCGGDCPTGTVPTLVCRFSLADGDCRCVPTDQICAEVMGDGSGICGGFCPSPNDRCALARGDERQIPPCICFRSDTPCSLDESQVCGGECPPALACLPSSLDPAEPCKCQIPPTTTTTTSSTTSTTTSTSPTSTTTSSSTTTSTSTTSTTLGGPCSLDTQQSPPVCGGSCPATASCVATPNNQCVCVTPGATCAAAQAPICGGLCPNPGQRCVDTGEGCACTAPGACHLDTTPTDPVCAGFCDNGMFCAFDPDDEVCECRPFNDFCQPAGEVCGGLCDAPDLTCVRVDLGPPQFGCQCQPMPQ
jgi:hypothetical protein